MLANKLLYIELHLKQKIRNINTLISHNKNESKLINHVQMNVMYARSCRPTTGCGNGIYSALLDINADNNWSYLINNILDLLE